jgi:hypothetical protein
MPVLCNPFVSNTSPPLADGNLYQVTVTVPSGTVASNLADFPVMVRLSEMPAGFWTHVKEDGGDIRVAVGLSFTPMDLARFDYVAQDGVLFFRAASLLTGSDNVFTIRYGNAALVLRTFTDPNGRNAVWDDYEAVYLLGETSHNRTGGDSLRITGDPDLFEEVATSPDINGHEGVTTDGTHYYVIDERAIRKYDLSWTLVATNNSVASGTGNPGIDALNGGDYYDGKLYIPVGAGAGRYLATYLASDLSFDAAINVAGQPHSGLAGLAYYDGLLYGVKFATSSLIYKVGLDGSAQGTIALSSALTSMQDITYWRGAFWIAVDGTPDETFRVELDGTVTVSGMYGSHGSTAWEGLVGDGDVIRQLDDTGGLEYVRSYAPYDMDLGAGGGGSFWSDARCIGDLTSTGVLTSVWTAGVTLAPSDNVQRTPMALTQAGSSNAGNVQVTVDDGTKLGVWDSTNLWLYLSPNVDPALDTSHRVNVVYNGTTARHIYYNGGDKETDSTITARGSAIAHLVMGSAFEGSQHESWRGTVGFAYCRVGVLSDAWIAAEYDNLDAPDTFSTLGAEVEL